MAEGGSDELVEAQREVIRILFEVVRRLQANNDLDAEYFGMVSAGQADQRRVGQIMAEREENARIAGMLLAKLDPAGR